MGEVHDEATLRFYAQEAPQYAAVEWADTAQLDAFLDRLRPGAEILELGCGGGRQTAAMLARGFAVEPTDGVPEMAAEAEARLGRPVAVMRFDQLDAVERYDAVWANACLLHVPREGLPAILSRIFDALKPGGYHFASFKSGGAEGRDGFGRYYNYPTPTEIEALYAEAGDWDVVALEEGQGGGYDGRPAPWVAVTLRKDE